VCGPYEDIIHLWEDLLGQQFMTIRNIILGGDLKFTVRRVEIWGSSAWEDPLADLCIQKFEEVYLVNVEPMKCTPTRWNLRIREERIAKRREFFCLLEEIINDPKMLSS